MKNLWKSVYTGIIYEMDIDWLPQFGGWELVGTIEKQCLTKLQVWVYNKEKRERYKGMENWNELVTENGGEVVIRTFSEDELEEFQLITFLGGYSRPFLFSIVKHRRRACDRFSQPRALFCQDPQVA